MNIKTQTFVTYTKHQWTETLSDYPASDYSLTITFRKGYDNIKSIQSVADGDSHSLTIEAGDIQVNGSYQYQAIAEKDGVGYHVESGFVTFMPNLSAEADPTTYWQTIYNNYRDAYTRLSSREVASISVLGQTFTYTDRAEIVRLMKHAENEMHREIGSPAKKQRQVFPTRFFIN
jgi:hypothetical protein